MDPTITHRELKMSRALALLTSSILVFVSSLSFGQQKVDFQRDIQPLFSERCLNCHGPDLAEGGLRLDVRDAAVSEMESGETAILPGKSASSELLRRIKSTDESERMPPEGEALTAAQIGLLEKWIDEGAVYSDHWSFRPVRKPKLPQVQDSETQKWMRNELDSFVAARLLAEGLRPSPKASRAKLIKRLYYDLWGLPPEPEAVTRFEQDSSPDAYETLVDELLESPHFAERWGRHWLDKARYADSDGYEKDRPRPNAWRYRDWVIDSIHRDQPFDEFTVEQLAGDLLPEADPMQRLATAFHRQTLTNTEGGTDQEQFRVEATFDRAETTAAIWLGLTMNCARCHNHKYDQISQREYYQLFAFFNDANESKINVAHSAEAQSKFEVRLKEHERKIADLQRQLSQKNQGLEPEFKAWVKQLEAAAKSKPTLKEHSPELVSVFTKSGASFKRLDGGVLRAEGSVADKDKYTLNFRAPESPLTGIVVEMLTDPSLSGNGPGRAPNGNFVLSRIRAYIGSNPEFKGKNRAIEFASAEADFSQQSFSPEGVLSKESKSGWAISPQMGKSHRITVYSKKPIEYAEEAYLRVVLDQQYGGQHIIGKFRIRSLTGFDALRSLPVEVAKAIRKPANQRSEKQRQLLWDHFVAQDPATAELASELKKLLAERPKPPTLSVRVLTAAKRSTRVLRRGDFLQPEELVSAGSIESVAKTMPLKPRDKKPGADRLDFARWLVHENHPLTARVTVNHVWSHLFGEGIVRTVNDFGVRGELPTHPGLLDYLAWHFPRELAWSRKRLVKLIVTSATYRQDSAFDQPGHKIDPTNRLLWRQNRIRVSAEVVRDLHLAVSGLLNRKVGGPSVFPPLPAGVADLSYANNFKWKTSSGEDRYRRGMYTFFKRTSPHPNLISFDCPDSNTAKLKRDNSNTPLQALATLNNEVFFEAAQASAQRVLSHDKESDFERLQYALKLCLARTPSTIEVERFEKLLNDSRAYYLEHPEAADKLAARHRAESVSTEENAAWIATIRMITNLDEFIVRE